MSQVLYLLTLLDVLHFYKCYDLVISSSGKIQYVIVDFIWKSLVEKHLRRDRQHMEYIIY